MDMRSRRVYSRDSSTPLKVPEHSVESTSQSTTSVQQVMPRKNKKYRKWAVLTVIITSILLVAVAIVFIINKRSDSPSVIDSNKFQAVFLTNGQVYFGRLSRVEGYYKLDGVYYLQNKTGEKVGDGGQLDVAGDVQLVKLGDEVHGPDGTMIIEPSQMLFFENLKNDGSVAQSIRQHQQ